MEFEVCDLGEVSIFASKEDDKYFLRIYTFSGSTNIVISSETFNSLQKDIENKVHDWR